MKTAVIEVYQRRRLNVLTMVEEIAVATTSGKAYYRLADELKKRHATFLSLRPAENVPPHIKVVITTDRTLEGQGNAKILIYDENDDPVHVVEDALRVLSGKNKYDEIVVGVDPGKRLGVVILGDGSLIKSENYSDVEKAAETISQKLTEIKADRKIVKIGDGAGKHGQVLVKVLDETLPSDIVLEYVKEDKTTKIDEKYLKHRRGLRDEMAATKISARAGRRIKRQS